GAEAANINQQGEHRLAGAVVSDLAAAVAVDRRDRARVEHVFGLAGLAEGKDGGMLERPEFVRGVTGTLVGKRLHRLPAGRIIDSVEAADEGMGHGWQV